MSSDACMQSGGVVRGRGGAQAMEFDVARAGDPMKAKKNTNA